MNRELSPREQELADALHAGKLCRKEIAAAMGITGNTLHDYIKRIYTKLRINSISELVLLMERRKNGAAKT
jgi:DNA-binding NarL/FixJ family response regulator